MVLFSVLALRKGVFGDNPAESSILRTGLKSQMICPNTMGGSSQHGMFHRGLVIFGKLRGVWWIFSRENHPYLGNFAWFW